jgi:phosphonate transport system substrate-binding protein
MATFLLAGCLSAGGRTYIDLTKLEPARPAAAPAASPVPLRIAVSPSLSSRDTVGSYRQIAEHIAIQTGYPTELIYRRNNSEAQALLSSQSADLAFFSTGAYLTYNGTEPIETLVIPEMENGPFYQSLIIVPQDSRIENIAGLSGKRFAFSDVASFSGYLFPVYLLKLRQQNPESFFGQSIFSQNHAKSLQSVAMNLLDGAAIDSIAYDHARRNNPALANAVRIIHSSEPIGTGPVVIRQSLPEPQKDLLKTIFLNMHHNQDMRKVLRDLMFERFSQAPANLYDAPRQILQEMKQTP